MMKHFETISASALLIAAMWTSSVGAMTASQISIVPGADIVGFVAIDKANAAPIIKKHRGADAPEGKELSQAFAAKSARFEAATGLTGDDILSIAFSCDMDTLNFKGTTQRERVAAAQAIAAIQVAKPISIEKIKRAIKLEYGSQDFAGVTDIDMGGRAGLRIKAPQPADPDFFLAVTPDQRMMLTSFNANALTAALERTTSGSAIPEPANLSRIKTVLPAGSQFQMACIIPPGVRASINEGIATMGQQATQDPGMAAVVGFARLFSGLQNLCVGVKLDNDALVSVAGSLGTEQAAQKAAILLETMIIPMIQASMMTPSAGSPPPDLDNMVTVNTKNTALQIELRLTEEQIMQASKQTAPATTSTPVPAP